MRISSLTLIAFLLLSASALAQQQPSSGPRPSEQNDASAKRQHETDHQLSAIATELRAIREQQAKTEQRAAANKTQESDTVFWPPIWSNWVLAAITVAAVIIALCTLKALNKQVAANTKQAKLTKAMLVNTQNTNRAWISLETLHIEIGPDDDHRFIVVGLKNSGRTPARIVNANVTVNGELPDQPQYSLEPFTPPALLVAGETTQWRHKVVFDLQNSQHVAFMNTSPGGENKFWIYGFIEYTDQFNPSRPHRYGFAREYDWDLSRREKRFMFQFVSNKNYDYSQDGYQK